MRAVCADIMKNITKTVRKWSWSALALLVTAVCLFGLLRDSSSAKQQAVSSTTVAMGSVVTQSIYSNDSSYARETAQAVNKAVSDLEKKISWRIEGSEIYLLNSGKSLTLSQDTDKLLAYALDVFQKSGGAFDCAILGISSQWDFDAEQFSPPSSENVENALANSGSENIVITNGVYTLTGGVTLDLGALGKGAACDVAIDMYRTAGVDAAIVTVGGSVGVYGQKDGNTPWKIGVRDPNGSQSDVLGVISLTSGCVSTSGTYEKMKEVDGIKYHHILDPSTGFPADTDLISATVICESGALSDCLATAAVVLGKEDAVRLLDQYGVDYLLVTENSEIIVSDGMNDIFSLTANGYSLVSD